MISGPTISLNKITLRYFLSGDPSAHPPLLMEQQDLMDQLDPAVLKSRREG